MLILPPITKKYVKEIIQECQARLQQVLQQPVLCLRPFVGTSIANAPEHIALTSSETINSNANP